MQKPVKPPLAEPLAPHRFDQPARLRGDPLARLGRKVGGGENARVGLAFVEAMRVANCRPQ